MRKIYETESVIKDGFISREDGGDAMIYDAIDEVETIGDGCLFVRLQSWDEEQVHPLMTDIIGKKIRITVEVEED